MNYSRKKKVFSVLLSVLMALGVFNAGLLSLKAGAVPNTAVVHITPGEGVERLIVTNSDTGDTIEDGDTVEYGVNLAVHAEVHTAYVAPNPLPIRVNGEPNAGAYPVNTPDVYITSDDLEKKVYKLTFRPNGGQLVGNETQRDVSWDEPLPEAIRAVRPGYTFKGYMITYYLAYDENYTPLINHPLTGGGGFAEAQWEPTSYSITFDPGAGSLDGFWVMIFDGSGASYPDYVSEPVSFTYTTEDTKAVPEVVAPAGYTFTGWAVSGSDHNWSDSVGQRESLTGKYGSVTLTAQYEPNTNTRYTVRYYEMDVEGNYPSTAAASVTRYGTTDTFATAETNPPEGFYVDTDRSVLTGNIAGNGRMILKVYYARNSYTVKFVDADGNILQESEWLNGATPVCSAEIPEKAYDDTYHYIAGWDSEIVPVSENAVYTVVYTPEAHVFENYARSAPATCSANALEQGACACGKTNEREIENTIDPDAHDWGEWGVSEAASCTEDGEKIRYCQNDPAHYETEVIPASGHSWGEWITVTEATASSDGLERRMCLRCGEPEERSVSYVAENARQIQFVPIDNMHFLVHMGEYDYIIRSKTANAIYWNDSEDLNFNVVTGMGWKYSGYEVKVNGVTLEPNEDGSFTLPAGSGYAQINVYPVSDAASAVAPSGVCGYCGKVHPNHLWGRIVALFHAIILFFKNLFA